MPYLEYKSGFWTGQPSGTQISPKELVDSNFERSN